MPSCARPSVPRWPVSSNRTDHGRATCGARNSQRGLRPEHRRCRLGVRIRRCGARLSRANCRARQRHIRGPGCRRSILAPTTLFQLRGDGGGRLVGQVTGGPNHDRRVRAGSCARTQGNRRAQQRDPLGSGGNRSAEDPSEVVTGIDTKAGVVHLNDGGSNTGRDGQVPLATFESLGQQANTWPS
jgi:hypothetical protein